MNWILNENEANGFFYLLKCLYDSYPHFFLNDDYMGSKMINCIFFCWMRHAHSNFQYPSFTLIVCNILISWFRIWIWWPATRGNIIFFILVVFWWINCSEMSLEMVAMNEPVSENHTIVQLFFFSFCHLLNYSFFFLLFPGICFSFFSFEAW